MNKKKKKLSIVALISSISFLNFAEPINAMIEDNQEEFTSVAEYVFNNYLIITNIRKSLDTKKDLESLLFVNKTNAYISFRERFLHQAFNLDIPCKQDRGSNKSTSEMIQSVLRPFEQCIFITPYLKCLKWINLNVFELKFDNDSAAFLDIASFIEDKQKSLIKLDISNNHFNNQEIVKIAELLMQCDNLKELKIGSQGWQIQEDGINALKEFIKTNKSIEKLDISYFRAMKWPHIEEILRSPNNLQELIISGTISKMEFSHLILPFKLSSLKTLVFKDPVTRNFRTPLSNDQKQIVYMDATFSENMLHSISHVLAKCKPKKTLNLLNETKYYSDDFKKQINNDGVEIII